jgi:kynureninase
MSNQTNFENTLQYARELDKKDPLKNFRERFYIPILHGKDCIYFTGNSLGLQSKNAQDYVLDEMENWANYGVEGHFHGRNPWANFHEIFSKKLMPLLAASADEIVVMNQLTANLHLLLTTFYRPDKKRFKIICEENAFTSDLYAIKSHLELAGFNPEDSLIEVSARNEEYVVRNEDIISAIKEHGHEVALVLIGGVNYFTGQVFDMQSITAAAHEVGAVCGFDLAHAVGNIELHLHDWNVDFACWCSYKYLNSGPGAVGGAFIHNRYSRDKSLPRLAGWWGTDKHERFQFKKDFNPIPTAEGWQLSNAPVLSMAVHKAALDIFEEAGLENILAKGKKLSAYLLFILNEINKNLQENVLQIITPQSENEHGCQVSIVMLKNGKEVFEALNKNSVIADWRESNVIRIAPVPLYNTFEEVFLFGQTIKNYFETREKAIS